MLWVYFPFLASLVVFVWTEELVLVFSNSNLFINACRIALFLQVPFEAQLIILKEVGSYSFSSLVWTVDGDDN